MGTVYCATDPRIGRRVAIKVLTGPYSDNPDFLARFYREAVCTANLQHQNIVTVYELGDQDGYPFLVMEYLEGESLDSLISSSRALQISEKLEIIAQVCAGLQYAHQQGVIHRDIKPANIVVLKDGTPKIVDFGVAQMPGKRLTRVGQVVGSLCYMSPEQLAANTELDCRTDVYSAGVVLFQLLTGALPFESKDAASTIFKIANGPRPSLGDFISNYPVELDSINQKALAKDREHRYSSAEEFGSDLARLQQQLNEDKLSRCLDDARAAIHRRNFEAARQQLAQVQKIDRRNRRAKQVSNELQKAVEAERRSQQASKLRLDVEEALVRKDFDSAKDRLRQAEALQADRDALQSLKNSIVEAERRATSFEQQMSRAHLAFQRGELEKARQAVEQALALQPGEVSAKELAVIIARRLETSTARSGDLIKRTKKSVMAGNLVEKAVADAELMLSMGRLREAEAVLSRVIRETLFVPAELRSRVEAVRQELERQTLNPRSGSNQQPAIFEQIPGPNSNDSLVVDKPIGAVSDARVAEFVAGPNSSTPSMEVASPQPARERWTAGFIPRSSWLWVGFVAAAVALTSGLAWTTWRKTVKFDKATARQHSSAPQNQAPYVEINAEPWGTVKQIFPQNGGSVLETNDLTPLRIKLNPGHYVIRVEGPNQQSQTVDVNVPDHGGQSYFVFFGRPDIDKLIATQ
ncbi:MAG: protein kinase [Acidobacteriaceae bacterium]|nr:protein kinase [Acidobacteriaceae bacterium]